MADPAKLFVKATGATNPYDQKYDIYYLVNNVPTRVNLCGFSYFDELGGLNLNAPEVTRGLDLRGPSDPAPNPLPVPPKYSLTFDEYLDKLHGSLINWIRVFVTPEFKVRVYPFTGSLSLKFNLHEINAGYISRLVSFVEKARARGIVVCLSFFSAQALKQGGLAQTPFYRGNNNNNIIIDSAGATAEVGFNDFFNIQQPPGQPSPYNNNWTQPQKLWWIQKNLITNIVNATKPYWNVAYEIFNEPSARITNIVPWHVTVANWLKELLWDPAAGRRSRLVAINAGDDLIENGDPAFRLVDALLPANAPALFDLFCFHGGGGYLPSQWGGPHGKGTANVCSVPLSDAPGVDQVVNGADETIPGNKMIHHNGILDAMRRFQNRPVALLFDTDAQYWAQRNVTRYVEEVLNVDGSYNYRWSSEYLNAVNDSCAELSPLQLGLDQRLSKIRAARNRGRITVF